MARKGRARIHSLGWLIATYKESRRFKNLRPATKEVYLRAFERLRRLHDSEIVAIKRRHIVRIQDNLADKPATANQVVKVAHMLFAKAVEDELIPGNPLARIEKLEIGRHKPWRDDQIAYALKALREGHRRALILALYTGQRRGDVVAMRWTDIRDGYIEIVQQKTGEEVSIPLHPALEVELAEWAKDKKALTILWNERNQPHVPRALTNGFGKALREHPHLAGLTFHGLRATCATALAEDGATVHEIASITGHQTLQMVQHYSKGADKKRRATKAIAKMRTFGLSDTVQVLTVKG